MSPLKINSGMQIGKKGEYIIIKIWKNSYLE